MDWLIFGSFNIIIMVLMFLFLSRRLHKQYNNASFLKEVQQEINAIVTELNQTTERNVQIIEERMEAVKALVAQLDRRIMLAQTEESQRSDSQASYAKIQDQRRLFQRDLARNQVPSVPLEPPAPIQTPEPEPEPLPARAIPSGIVSEPEPVVVPRELAGLRQTLSRDSRKAQVVEMFHAGIASPLIAQHIGMSLGEVELIISLQT